MKLSRVKLICVGIGAPCAVTPSWLDGITFYSLFVPGYAGPDDCINMRKILCPEIPSKDNAITSTHVGNADKNERRKRHEGLVFPDRSTCQNCSTMTTLGEPFYRLKQPNFAAPTSRRQWLQIGAIGASISLIAFVASGCNHANESAIPLNSNTNAPILLFNGSGTSPNDVTAVEKILNEQHLKYSTIDSSQMNDMPESRLRSYRLLIIPGGNYIAMGNGLLPSTSAKIHDAVQAGLNYLGICAGGLIAGDSVHNGLNLTSGIRFDFYSAVNHGIHKAAVAISGTDTPTLDQYWEDGPQFTGWGEVVAQYPDGTPAVVEGKSGDGWVILCGVHPEAPASWRRGMNFRTPVSDDNAYAAMLVRAALDGTWLSHF